MQCSLKKLIPPRAVRWIIPFWTILLIAGSLSPGRTKQVIGSTRLGEQGRPEEALLTGDIKHRMFHWLGFGSTAFLFLCLTRTPRKEALAAAGAFGIGVAIETAQLMIYHSGFEWDDVRDDALAVAFVYLVIAGWEAFARRLDHAKADSEERPHEKQLARAAPSAVSNRFDS